MEQMGYSVQKVAPVSPFLLKRKKFKKPLYIEFVGAAGVGKSYLYDRLIRSQRDWIDSNYFALNLVKDLNTFYDNLAMTKLHIILQRNYACIDKLNLISFFRIVLLRDFAIKHANVHHIVSNGDGILHNFGDALIEMMERVYAADLKWFLLGRTVVFCYANPDIVVERIIKRHKTIGRLNPQHKHKSPQELLEDQLSTLETKRKFIEKLEQLGVDIIRINTADPCSENVDKISSAISKWALANEY
ncbi:MAG: hypothetical protein QM446_04725 [Synergistota bacterium]|nr:hypothetical protein [Synergistota bacterium]